LIDNVDDALEEQELARLAAEQQRRVHSLLKRVDFGLQVQQFLDGEIGQRILVDTERETLALLKRRAELDPRIPEQTAEWQALGDQLGIHAHWQDAFARYIADGRAAETELHEGEGFVPNA
jgi:hypothetical protein